MFGFVLLVISTSVLIGVVVYGVHKVQSSDKKASRTQMKKQNADPERFADPLTLTIAKTR